GSAPWGLAASHRYGGKSAGAGLHVCNGGDNREHAPWTGLWAEACVFAVLFAAAGVSAVGNCIVLYHGNTGAASLGQTSFADRLPGKISAQRIQYCPVCAVLSQRRRNCRVNQCIIHLAVHFLHAADDLSVPTDVWVMLDPKMDEKVNILSHIPLWSQTRISETYVRQPSGCLFCYPAASSMLPMKMPYPVVESLTSTWVTAPTSMPFCRMGLPDMPWTMP